MAWLCRGCSQGGEEWSEWNRRCSTHNHFSIFRVSQLHGQNVQHYIRSYFQPVWVMGIWDLKVKDGNGTKLENIIHPFVFFTRRQLVPIFSVQPGQVPSCPSTCFSLKIWRHARSSGSNKTLRYWEH